MSPSSSNSDKHSRVDIFIADINVPSAKDDIASMEHPLFALRAGDRAVRIYHHRGTSVTVKPGSDGCATIHDKDIWIYCASQLIEAQNLGLKIERRVQFVAYDFLIATNRGTGGKEYEQLTAALVRLKGTTVETNIETAGKRTMGGFGLIDSYLIVKDKKGKKVAIEVVLPDWLFRSIKSKKVLSLSREYFRIRKPLHRRIYELARKHCGRQIRWPVKIRTLHGKSGSRSSLRRFRFELKNLAELGELPGYHIVYNPKKDSVMFYPWGKRGAMAQLEDTVKEAGKGPKLSCE